MNTSEYAAVAAVHSVDPDRWWTEFSAVIDRIAPRFARYEPLRHAAELMLGMVSGLDRKNCWTIEFEVPARTESVEEVANGSAAALFGPPAKSKGLPVGPGRTAATSSRLLYEAIGRTYEGLGFDAVGDEVFRDLVIARIVEPTSKLDSLRVLTDLGANTVSYRTIQRHLRSVVTDKYRDVITKKCFAHSRDRGTMSLLLYDVTTLYFEVENEDDLRKVGYSKERRVDPQIVVGMPGGELALWGSERQNGSAG